MLQDFINTDADLRLQKNGMYRGSCPNHSKKNTNLMVIPNDGGGLNVYCHAHCTEIDILEGFGFERPVLFPQYTPEQKAQVNRNQVLKAVEREKDAMALKLWTEINVIRQAIEARVFNVDDHPKNRTECWDREKQALYQLPDLIKQYYK